jgi:hypothetical protein
MATAGSIWLKLLQILISARKQGKSLIMVLFGCLHRPLELHIELRFPLKCAL